MKLVKSIVFLIPAMAMLAMAGCGSDNREGATAGGGLAASQACIGCHANNKISPVTGITIVSEYLKSAHSGSGASCPDCHKPTGHPNGGITTNPIDKVCGDCHTQANMSTGAAHFSGGSSLVTGKAAYVAPYDANTCRVCHNPHDMTSVIGINKQWAESGHGNAAADPWSHYPWRTKARNACSRCHTAGGFRSYMTNNLVQPSSVIFGKYTTGHETLGCKGCHTDYSWKRLSSDSNVTFALFSTPYKTSSAGIPRTFPALQGDSNICIPCHAGLESGESVKTAVADYTNASFKNSHYLAAAGVFYQKAGFHYYTSAAKMTNTWNHGNLGVNNYVTSAGQATGNNGPCVACHMNGSHTLDAIAVAKTTGATGCYGCHGGEDMALLNEEEKANFDCGMDFFTFNLNANGMYYNTVYPYFYTSAAATTQLKNWTNDGSTNFVGPTGGTGAQTMGAAFNYNLLFREKGAHVHNRKYARRLIFDSVEYLQFATVTNQKISFGAYSTAKPAGFGGVSISSLKSWLTTSGKRK